MIGRFEIRKLKLSQKAITYDCSGKIYAVVNSTGTLDEVWFYFKNKKFTYGINGIKTENL